MKKNRFIGLLLVILFSVSCTDQLRKEQQEMAEDVNIKTLPEYLLSGSIVAVSTFYQDKGVDNDEFNALMFYYQQLFSVKAQTHEEFQQAPDDWNREYNIIYDLQSGINYNEEEGRPSTAAALKVLQSFMFEYLTDIYGDIPYSEALKGREGLLLPKYDTQQEVYEGLMATLDEAVATLKGENDAIDAVYDLIYKGDRSKWIKFANSLKLRMLMRSYTAFGDKQGQLEAIATSDLITSADDDAYLTYEGTNSSNSWVWGTWRDEVQSEMTRRKPSAPFVNSLKGDPRLSAWVAPSLYRWTAQELGDPEQIDTLYFGEPELDYYGNEYSVSCFDTSTVGQMVAKYPFNDSVYVGAPPQGGGLNIVYAPSSLNKFDPYNNVTLSSYTQIFNQNSGDFLRATLMEAGEVNFALAEAKIRGWLNGGQSAETYYHRGIEENMKRWGISADDIAAYIAVKPLPSGTDEALEAIMTEKYKALFTQGHQSWFEYRRTAKPSFIKESIPESVVLPFPLRWRYPTIEMDNNTANVEDAISRLEGGDVQTGVIWILKGTDYAKIND